MYCQLPDTRDHNRAYTGAPAGIPLTVADRLVPCDWVYRFPSLGTVETHSQYWVTPVPLVQLNVTVDDVRIVPGAGATICASTTAPGVLVAAGCNVVGVGGGVFVAAGVVVAVGRLVAVPTLVTVGGLVVGVLVEIGVPVGAMVGIPAGVGLAAGVEVATPGPYG